MIKESEYRLNVGLIIINNKGKLLLCKRKKSNNWQFPQGGVDTGEKSEDAALRELYEEVGIKEKSIKKIYVSKTWYKYDVPEAKKFRNFLQDNFRGQKQQWFMFELIEDVKIDFTNDPNPEFDDYMWSSYWYPLYSIVDFKKEVYRSVLKEFCQPYVERFS